MVTSNDANYMEHLQSVRHFPGSLVDIYGPTSSLLVFHPTVHFLILLSNFYLYFLLTIRKRNDECGENYFEIRSYLWIV